MKRYDRYGSVRRPRRRQLQFAAMLLVPVALAFAALLWDAPVAREASGQVVAAPAAGCGRTHVLQEGETLESIAEKELGAASRWQEISKLNRALLDRISLQNGFEPGLVLELPGTGCGG
jgi:nucleoid-associated protein YgaU